MVMDQDAQLKALMRRQVELWKQVTMWILIWWKIFFAFVAFLDLTSCWDTLYMGWMGESIINLSVCPAVQLSTNNSHHPSSSSASFLNVYTSQRIRHSTCYAAYSLLYHIRWVTDRIRELILPIPLHGLFCVLCLVEMSIRAIEAHRLAVENQVIARLEESLSRVYSTTRMYAKQIRRASWRMGSIRGESTRHQEDYSFSEGDDDHGLSSDHHGLMVNNIQDRLLARSTLRLWVPVGVTCLFWISMLPRTMEEYITPHPLCGTDTALATEWTITAFTKALATSSFYQELIQEYIWGRFVMPYNFVSQPRRFWRRVRHLLRIIKLIRFAGPFMRMFIKLLDQLYAIFKARRQEMLAKMEREKRVRRHSLLWEDLQQIESITKVQTRLASLPSQLFELAQEHLPAGAAIHAHRMLQQQKKQGRYIKRQLKNLQRELQKSMTSFTRADIYDRIANLNKNVTSITQRQNTSAMFKFLQSPDLLISPRSRFSVVWRMTVTNCLSIEMTRLGLSWYLTNTFQLSITQVISRLFIHCQHPKDTQKHLRFLTDHIDHIHKALATAIPLIPMPEEKWIVCVPTSISARLFLQLGFMMETFIDVVTFMDIFFWFFTGDLDELGFVVPKNFVTRCIIPGTLVQVLDHPTLPEVLPSLIRQAVTAAVAAGWSRTMRWVFAICPALNLLCIQPLTNYFFRHLDESWNEDGWNSDVFMKCAESMGYLPKVPSSRRTTFREKSSSHRRTHSPSSLSVLNLQRALNTPLRTMPDMARSTPSTFTDDDENLYVESIRLDDDAPGVDQLFLSTARGGFDSPVRFSRDVTILERLDSVDTAEYRSDGSSHHYDDSTFDIGYSLSARDLTSLQEQDQ